MLTAPRLVQLPTLKQCVTRSFFAQTSKGFGSVHSSNACLSSTKSVVGTSLKDFDSELYGLIGEELKRQKECISLIASENHTPRYCSDALASCLASRYSEGYPGDRYYAGNQTIDKIETLCTERALKAFGLDPIKWTCIPQALSGCNANMAVFVGLLKPRDRILHLDLPHGGHLSHGFQSATAKVTATSQFYESMAYKLDPRTELINYDEIALLAQRFRPKILIAGYSAYSRLLDYKRLREIADGCGAYLMSDIAHISGLMAAGVIPSAFDHSDVVTTTTHKTLRGPRGALIFGRKELQPKLRAGLFPGLQGGPHNHSIAAIAACLKAATEPEFREYQERVLECAKALAQQIAKPTLKSVSSSKSSTARRGFRIVTGGTDNHMVLVDLSQLHIRGTKASKLLEAVNIIVNKNTIATDLSPKNPSAIRLGTPAMCTRGFDVEDFRKVGDWIVEAILYCDSKYGKTKSTAEFAQKVADDQFMASLKKTIKDYVLKFPHIPSPFWPNF